MTSTLPAPPRIRATCASRTVSTPAAPSSRESRICRTRATTSSWCWKECRMASNPVFPMAPDEVLQSAPDAAFPAHLFMPPDGFPFDYTAYIATPAVGVISPVISFTVPEGHYGVIKKIGNVYVGAGFVEGSGSLVWQILQNAGVVRNYDNILAGLGTVTQPGEV